MIRRSFQNSGLGRVLAVVLVLGLAGCGAIEFESKLLDQVGLSPSGLFGDGKHKDEKLETRTGIVVPPSVETLPVPGQQNTAVATAGPSFPQNPETVAAQQKREAEAKRKIECDPANGAYGSRQSGQHSDVETAASEHNSKCATSTDDIFGN